MTHDSRPLLHLTPARGWVNDPLGLTWHDGRYHLFFQHVPDSTDWQVRCHWGHATSADLVHWTEHEPILAPGDGDDGVWSGSIAVPADGGPAALFYTSVTESEGLGIGRVRVAHPVDASWDGWVKGPVVAELPSDVDRADVEAYRDPWVVRQGDAWWMVVGGGLRDPEGGTATAWVYRSSDLDRWEYHGLLTTRHTTQTDGEWTGPAWECPQLFPLGDRWVLTLSVWEPDHPHHAVWAVGDFADGRFTAERWGRLTYGPAYYAGSAFADRDGRRGLVHWMRGVAGKGWAGAQSVPHLLRLVDGAVVCAPHPGLEVARSGAAEVDATAPGHVPGRAADVVWRPGGAGTLRVVGVADLRVDGPVLEVVVGDGRWTMPCPGEGEIRVVIDGPTLEVFTEGGVLGAAVPSREALEVVVVGAGTATVHALA